MITPSNYCIKLTEENIEKKEKETLTTYVFQIILNKQS